MKSVIRFTLVAAAITLANVGCGPVVEEGPSYADLVVTYNAELETLDRLEKKRSEMVANYERTLRPSAEDALQALGDVFNTRRAADPYAEEGLAADPHDMLDQAVASAANVDEATSQLLAAAAQQTGADRESLEAQYSEEFKQQLAAIDEEIAKQQQRVDRARKARDAAEK
jgi:hypothetical protein